MSVTLLCNRDLQQLNFDEGWPLEMTSTPPHEVRSAVISLNHGFYSTMDVKLISMIVINCTGARAWLGYLYCIQKSL